MIQRTNLINYSDICYGEDLRAAIMNKKLLDEEELHRRQVSIYNDEKAEAMRRQQISQERLMMLQEHAPQLQGFFKVKGISLENFENSLSETACRVESVEPSKASNV